jgi:microcystin-dependent protein
MEPIMGQIIMFAGNYAPRGWAFCHGQLLTISQHSALFSILGTTYGGDGRFTFALPDLRGRVAVGCGQGDGLSSITQGVIGGKEMNQLSTKQMPSHTHTAEFTGTGGSSSEPIKATVTVNAKTGAGNQDNPDGNYWSVSDEKEGPGRVSVENSYSDSYDVQMASDTVKVNISGGSSGITGGNVAIENSGEGQPFDIMQPYLGLNYIIALQGIYPSRN